jgi:hypothetical protein
MPTQTQITATPITVNIAGLYRKVLANELGYIRAWRLQMLHLGVDDGDIVLLW